MDFETLLKLYELAAKPEESQYSQGYQRGLRRHYHGEQFGTEAEHEQWLALDGHHQELGDGYRDGFAGQPPRYVHAGVGNKNAQQDEQAATSTIYMRVTPERKALYVKAAQSQEKKLSRWIQDVLDEQMTRT